MGILNTALPRVVGSTLLLLVSGSALGGRTYDLLVQITDLSGPNSPIKASGKASFRQELSPDSVKTQCKIEIQLVNGSSKSILAYEVSIVAMSDYGGGIARTSQADYFFRPELELGPGAHESLDEPTPSWSVTPRKEGAKPITPKATFQVIFVQFSDGSKFGASQWGSALSAARQRTIKQLQLVLQGFRKSGEEGLRLALAKARGGEDNPASTDPVLDEVKETLEAKGPEAAVTEITGFLDAAQKRRSVM